MLKDLQKLNTSDAEKLVKKKLNVNSLIIVAVQYCVDKKICWQTNIFEKSLDEFEIIDVKRQLNNVIEIQHDVEQKWQTISIIVIVKFKHSRAVRKQQTMKDLSAVQWIAVADLIVIETTEWKPQLTIIINIFAEIDKKMTKAFKNRAVGWKRSRDEISDSLEFDSLISTSKPSRRIRINHLLDQAEACGAAEENVGKFHKRLTDRWFCNDKRCINSTHGKS